MSDVLLISKHKPARSPIKESTNSLTNYVYGLITSKAHFQQLRLIFEVKGNFIGLVIEKNSTNSIINQVIEKEGNLLKPWELESTMHLYLLIMT